MSEPIDKASAPRRPKFAIFVHGLEHSIPSREAYPPLLSSLNLKRELFRQQVPHPLLLWLPDYALTALARKAPDFWAWRSGLYEFAPERAATEQSLDAVYGQALHITESLSERVKRDHLVMLKGLLDDYRELGDGPHEKEARANILNEIGLVHEVLGELVEAKQAYGESLTISRILNDKLGEAVALHNLGGIAQVWRDMEEARRLYNESLEIKKELGNERSSAVTLHQLALLSQEQGELEQARHLYNESLEISKRHGNQHGVSSTLHQLGNIAKVQGEIKEARRLYDDSLGMSKKLGDHYGVAITLAQLGNLAEDEGDKAEAARLYREALYIFERLGSPYAERARQSWTRMEGNEDVSG